MNRRFRKRWSNPEESFLRYLKPGALAQLRDLKINARSHRAASISQIYLHRTSSSPSSSPSRNPPQSHTAASNDGLPCFSGSFYGPRCPQRKKLLAAKSVFFPVSVDVPDPIIDLSSTDFLVAH